MSDPTLWQWTTRQPPVQAHNPERDWMPLWALFLFCCLTLLVFSFLAMLINDREREVSERAALEAAVASAPRKIAQAFATWRATTVEDGTALQWSGANSKLLYVEYQAPASVNRYGDGTPARWVAWARAASGRIFVVSYFDQPDGSFVASGEPQRSTQTELVKTLVKGKRLDLVDQLELPKRPA
jgi:hypothetical protein